MLHVQRLHGQNTFVQSLCPVQSREKSFARPEGALSSHSSYMGDDLLVEVERNIL